MQPNKNIAIGLITLCLLAIGFFSVVLIKAYYQHNKADDVQEASLPSLIQLEMENEKKYIRKLDFLSACSLYYAYRLRCSGYLHKMFIIFTFYMGSAYSSIGMPIVTLVPMFTSLSILNIPLSP